MYEKKYFVGSICIFSHQENCGHVKSTCKSCTRAVNREKSKKYKAMEKKLKEEDDDIISIRSGSNLTRENIENKNKIDSGILYLTEELTLLKEKLIEQNQMLEEMRIRILSL